MRKVLTLLSILICACLFVQAQQIFNPYHQLRQHQWFKGHYYDLSETKVSGLLSDYIPEKNLFGLKGTHFNFKKDKSAKDEKIKLVNIKSILIPVDSVTVDSFVVSKSTLLAEAPILKVLLNTIDKKLKLYTFMSVTYSGKGGAGIGAVSLSISYSTIHRDYYYGTTPDDVTELTKKNFKTVMLELFGDEPDVAKMINNGTFRVANTENVINHYYRMKRINARLAEQAASK